MPVCQVCQQENPAGAEYCEDCGAALTAAGAPTPVGASVSGSGSAAASAAAPTGAAGESPVASAASAAGSVGSLAPEGPATSSADAAPATPPTPAPPSTAGTPAAPSASGSSGQTAASAAPSTSPGAPPTPPDAPSTAGPQVQGRLVTIRYGAPTGEEIPLFGQRLMVGRFDPETGPVDVDLSALDEGGHISRQHGELYRENDGAWMVRDLGSTNGIFVKGGDAASFGPRITAPRALADGDEIAFGNVRFLFKTS